MTTTYSGTALLRNHGTRGAGDGLRPSQPDGSIVLALSDGAHVDLVSMHRYRHPRIWPLAQSRRGPHYVRHGRGLLGSDRRRLCRGQCDHRRLISWRGDSRLFMYHQRPVATAALILSGTGYTPKKEWAGRRIDAYRTHGIDYRWRYTFEDLSPAFRATPLAHYFAELFTERNELADVEDHHPPVHRARAA